MYLQRSSLAFSITAVSVSMCLGVLSASAEKAYGAGLQRDAGAVTMVARRNTASGAIATKPKASVGEIVGTVKLPEGSKMTARDLAYSVVWLADVETPSEQLEEIAASRPHALLDQVDMAFTPHVVPILVGQEVEFRNSDGSVFHGVQSRSPAKKFNLGMYPSGQSKSAVFDKPGIVDIRCMVHSEMQAFIVVSPSPFFAQVTSDGSFTIHNAPAGKHTLHLWNPKIGPIEKTFSVSSGGTARVTVVLQGNPGGGAR